MLFIGFLKLGLNRVTPGKYVVYKSFDRLKVSKVKTLKMNSLVELENGETAKYYDIYDLRVDVNYPTKYTKNEIILTPYQWEKMLKHDLIDKYVKVKIIEKEKLLYAEFLGKADIIIK